MGSLSTRRMIRHSAPAKITIVEGNKGVTGACDAASNKENIVNCSLYSLFETHYERSNKTSPSKGHHPEPSPLGEGKGKTNNVLQPRKRSHNDRNTDPPSVAAAAEHSRELSPPELTTSDTFKPAKRTLASNNNKQQPGDEGGLNQLPNIRTPGPETSESCDVLVSSPTELKKLVATDPPPSKVSSSGRRDVSRKTPVHGRRFSIVRVSIAREGGALMTSKRDGSSSAKKHSAVGEQASGLATEVNGKDMVFSAKKRTPIADQLSRVQTEVDRARLKVLEGRKSGGQKTTPVGKQGIGSFGGRADIFRKDGSEKLSPVAAAQQTKSVATKITAESIRTRKLSMVLKSEQRLVEKNEQYGLQLRHLQEQMAGKDHEVERLRSAAMMLNNMINRQSEEIRELRFRLKETFNENAEVRAVCETLERELRKTREALRLERMQKVPTPCEAQLASLTTQFQSLAFRMTEPRMIESCIEEGQEDCESLGEAEDHEDCKDREDSGRQGVCAAQDGQNMERSSSNQVLLPNQKDEDVQYTLEDLQEMVMQEEDLMKERCANALKELNLPLTPLLNSKGSLDVGSLKAMLASISSKDEYLTPERMSSIGRLSAWIGLS